MSDLTNKLGKDDAQGIAEYAVMLAVALAVTLGTVQLIGFEANEVFSKVATSWHR